MLLEYLRLLFPKNCKIVIIYYVVSIIFLVNNQNQNIEKYNNLMRLLCHPCPVLHTLLEKILNNIVKYLDIPTLLVIKEC